ncbi:hypothetical protein JW707_02180 [Candidatus Woesearchaeota archaeon]|nr:hypothetical protein [Candidatus Woesearchaeota archaeon]
MIYTVKAADTDADGLDDDIESAGWTAEWYDCSNEWNRNHTNSSNFTPYTDYKCSEDPFGNITDGDCADDFGDRLWDLDARGIDTDGDGLIDWDYEDECRYCFPDPCPKHCNNYCAPEDADYWEMVVCGGCYDTISYVVVKDASNKIRFEGTSKLLGEGGGKFADVFTFNVSGSFTPLNATLKAGTLIRTITLNYVGDSDEEIGFKVTLVNVSGNIVTLAVESISPISALSHIEFEFPSNVQYTQSTYSSCRLLPRMIEFRELLADYIWKIQRLSYVFNVEDKFVPQLVFGLYSEWKYNDSDINFPDSWVNPAYNDSNWPSGDAYLGYNESLITTVLDYTANGHTIDNKTITYYFRKHFTINNLSALDLLEFNIDYDDGYVAYLNGYHLVNSTGSSTDHNTYVPYHESSIGDLPSQWGSYTLTAGDKSHLVEGDNVIAVEIHQCVPNSTDIVLGAYLADYENISAKGLLDNQADACSILSTTATDEDRLLRQLLTLWFNVVSSNICYMQFFCGNPFRTECASDYNKVWTLGCQDYASTISGCNDIDACTVEELIADAEDAIIDNATSQYSSVTDDMTLINDGSCLDCAVSCEPPENLEISLNADWESVDLTWDDAGASYYNIYYAEDPDLLINYEVGDALPSGMTKINVSGTNWTDWNAKDVKERYYRISSYINTSQSECLYWDIKGKFTYYFYGNTTNDVYARGNWMSITLDSDIRAVRDIMDACTALGGDPERVTRIERSQNKYAIVSDEADWRGAGTFLEPGRGYDVQVEANCNVTIVGGLLYEEVEKNLYFADGDISPGKKKSDYNPYFKADWVAANFVVPISDLTAHDVLYNVDSGKGEKIIDLAKDSSNAWELKHYVKDINDDVNLTRGKGYLIFVNDTATITLK